jgi:hypothetical protein
MQVLRGRGVYLLLILDLDTRWGRVVSVTLATLYPKGKDPLYPLNRRLGGASELVWTQRLEENLLLVPGIVTEMKV